MILYFSFLAKTGSAGHVEQQIKFVSPNDIFIALYYVLSSFFFPILNIAMTSSGNHNNYLSYFLLLLLLRIFIDVPSISLS